MLAPTLRTSILAALLALTAALGTLLARPPLLEASDCDSCGWVMCQERCPWLPFWRSCSYDYWEGL